MKRADAERLVKLYDLLRTARMSVVYYELRSLRPVDGIWHSMFHLLL